MRTLLLLLFLTSGLECAAQDLFKSIYDSSGGGIGGSAIIKNNDGTYTVLGKGDQFKMMHLDSAGNLSWTESINATNIQLDEDMAADAMSDSTFIIASTGYKTNNPAIYYKYDIILAKVDINGNALWVKSFGSKTSQQQLHNLKHTTDGGFIVVADKSDSLYGAFATKAYVVKLDPGGNIEWSKGYDRPLYIDIAYDVAETGNGFVIVGTTDSSTINVGSSGFMIKTDKQGNTAWHKGYSAPLGIVKSVLKDGDFFVLGGCSVRHDWADTPGDAVLLKTDSNGNAIWTKQYHFDHRSEATKVIKASDGVYLILGIYGHQINTYHGNDRCFLVKTDSSGNIQWCKIYGGSALLYTGNSVQQLLNGGYLININYFSSAPVMLTIGTDSLGNNSGMCVDTANPNVYSPVIQGSNIAFPEENYSDTAFSAQFSVDSYFLKVVDSCNIWPPPYVKVPNIQATKSFVNLYPNPSVGIINIETDIKNYEVEVVNALGIKVLVRKANANKLTIDMTQYPPGFYTCLIRTNDNAIQARCFILSTK